MIYCLIDLYSRDEHTNTDRPHFRWGSYQPLKNMARPPNQSVRNISPVIKLFLASLSKPLRYRGRILQSVRFNCCVEERLQIYDGLSSGVSWFRLLIFFLPIKKKHFFYSREIISSSNTGTLQLKNSNFELSI